MHPAPSAPSGWHPARLASIVLHPFVAFAVLALVAVWKTSPEALWRATAGMAAAIAAVGIFIWQRRRHGAWQTVDASRPHERPLLYLLVLSVVAGYWVWMGGSASATSSGVVAALAMLAVAGAANRWIKLSLHMASLAFAGVVLLQLLAPVGVAALACLPVLAWARLRMARHTWPEVIGGIVLGGLAGLALRLSA